jgi:hypothetical protein
MTEFDKITVRLRELKPGEVDPILLALRYATKKNIPKSELFDFISPAQRRELTVEQIELMESGDPIKVVSKDLDLDNPVAFLETANRYFNKFRLCRHKEQLFPFEVKDEDKKILVPIFEGDHQKILIREASRLWLKETGEPLSPTLAANLYKFWFNHIELIKMPEPMGRPNDVSWCLHRSNYSPDTSISFDSWQKILNRMSDPEAFCAWVWGIYTGLYKGRQMLWIHGAHGEDGKSTIASIIGKKLFGPAHNAISNASISSGEKRFLASFFENASLVVYPDANNRKCLMSEAFKSVASAGSDPVLIERKGMQAYTSTLKARMWICSNFAPEITNDNFVVSRLLYINIDKMVDEKPDPTVVKRLEDELPGFLAYAEKCYNDRCPDNYKVRTDDFTEQTIKSMAEQYFDEYETIFSKYWQLTQPDERVEGSRLREILKSEGVRSNIEYKRYGNPPIFNRSIQ